MEHTVFHLCESDDKKHLWKIVNKETVIYFGDRDCKNFTASRNVKDKLEYIKSHNNFWDNTNFKTGDFWVRWLLYNKSTIEKSIEDIETRFPIKIVFELKPLKRMGKNCYNTIRKTDRTISNYIADILV